MRIFIRGAVARFPEFRFTHPVDWTIGEGENWAVVGPNGAGKSLLTDLLRGRIVLREGETGTDAPETPLYKAVRSISFRDIYSLADCREGYSQQRWNASDAEQSPTAGSLLSKLPTEKIVRYAGVLGIGDLLDKRLVTLSSGELRKFLITRTLLEEPRVLILDNPFIGLDAASRGVLDRTMERLSRSGVQIVLVVSDPAEIPEWTDRVLPVRALTCLPPVSRREFLSDAALLAELFPERYGTPHLPDLPEEEERASEPYDEAIRMEAVRVRYGGRTILDGVDWTVRRGEKWALLGDNGSGKSTLLSLVCGDNPQAYANRLTLFGRRRGTGESIWEIKRRIGYLSPDVHTYYMKDIPCLQVAASGFFDSVGLYDKCTSRQRDLAARWLDAFGAGHLAGRPFVRISYGEQRLVLLARTLVKDPELLILDEPLHGLDAGKKERVRRIVETFCARPGKTLIYVTHYPGEIPACVTRCKRLEKRG